MRHLLQGLWPTSLLACVLLAFATAGCGLFGGDDDDQPDDSQPDLVDTFFEVTVNGEPWTETGATAYFSCQNIGLWFKVEGGRQAPDRPRPYGEFMSMVGGVYDGPGTYTLVSTERGEGFSSGSGYVQMNGDVVIGGGGSTDDSLANQLTITSYDPGGGLTENSKKISSNSEALEAAGVIEGTFRTTVVTGPEGGEQEPGEEAPLPRPDTMRFTDGRFRVGVVKGRDAFEECGMPAGVNLGGAEGKK